MQLLIKNSHIRRGTLLHQIQESTTPHQTESHPLPEPQRSHTFHSKQSTSTGDWEGFYKTVKSIATSNVPAPVAPPLKFEFTAEATEYNSNLLAEHGFDYSKLVNSSPDSTISYGSELRPMDQLEPLLGHMPNWDTFKRNATQGIDYPDNELPEEKRIELLEETIARGNHKSALSEEGRPHVTKGMISDVELGYAFPVSIDCVRNMPGAEVYPVGMQNQMTIDKNGDPMPKKRLTHDLSHNRDTGNSINQRVDDEEFPETQFGFALLRFIHLVFFIRLLNPNEPILCNKIDIEKAYRRLHVIASVAVKCIAVWFIDKVKQVGVVMTRLPFGSSPAPSNFSVTSEAVCDLSNDLLHCELWDPEELPSPYDTDLPQPKLLEDDIPFGHAEECDLDVPADCVGGAECYIDDIGTAVLASKDNWPMVKRARQVAGMALHLVFRPLAGIFEPIPRPDSASIRKMLAEGGLSEVITFLGWLIDTRRFIVAIPIDKWKAWTAQIKLFQQQKRVKYDDISQLIGRLNHVCFIIPDARHFMANLRKMESIARNKGWVNLSRRALDDLELWLEFLDSAKNGISINRIVFRKPTLITYSDSSEIGIGGYSPFTGVAWRYKFTEAEQQAFTLNCKEYIASAVDLAIQSRHDPNVCEFPCYLNRSDSTSVVGWMRKSNHDEDEAPIHNEIARFHARNMMQLNACNYSQHLPGKLNVVTDSFSRDFHLSTDQIIAMLTSTHPSLSPNQIKVVECPEDLTSMIASLAQRWPGTRELRKQHIKSDLAAGVIGWTSSNESRSTMTPIWMDSEHPKSFASAVHSCMQSEGVTLGQQEEGRTSWQTLPERPSIMWQRPLWRVIGKAPSSTQEERPTSS